MDRSQALNEVLRVLRTRAADNFPMRPDPELAVDIVNLFIPEVPEPEGPPSATAPARVRRSSPRRSDTST